MIFRVRPIPSCPGYFVSETGRVWSPRKELRPATNPDGYRHFVACFHGCHRTTKVDHAVAEAFLGPKPPGAWVCHRNDVPADNVPENLYYGNASSNLRDAYRNDRRYQAGERNGNAKLTWKQVCAIRSAVASGAASQADCARKYGVRTSSICHIVHHKRWANAATGPGVEE